MNSYRLIPLLILFLLSVLPAEAHYDPSIGRWISRDPMQEDGGHNLLGFNHNAPTSYYDILGNVPDAFSNSDVRWSADGQVRFAGATADTFPVGSFWQEPERSSNGKCIKIKGHLNLEVHGIYGLDWNSPTSLFGGTTTPGTVRQHEQTRVDIWRHWYEEFKRSVAGIDGCYCSEECAKIAEEAARTIARICMGSALGQNGAWGLQQYGFRLSPDPRAQLVRQINGFVQSVQASFKELDRLEKEWFKTKCGKTKPWN